MVDFSQKESIFPGYIHPESPDIDFNDVFGGPPRRTSIQDIQSSFKDSFEFRRDDEAISNRRQRWSGLSEKPVFGEESFSRRRRNASDNFFDDIFGGNGSLSGSPRNPLNLNHHKNKDGFLSGLFSDSPLSRFSSKVQEELRNSFSSPINDKLASLEQFEHVQKEGDMKDTTDFQVPSAGHHFSIFRWASKGVPLPSSFRRGCSSKMKERFNFERSSSASGRIACEGMAGESPAGTSNKLDSDFGIFAATAEVKKSGENKSKSTEKSSVANNYGEKVSKQDGKGMTPNNVEMEKSNAEETPISSQLNPEKNRAKGIIKEFLKIYDQDISDQSTARDSLGSRSFRAMERGEFRTHDEQNFKTRNIYQDRPSTSTGKADALPKEPEKRGSGVRINDNKEMNICSSGASIPNGSEVRDENVADSFLENIQVKELTQIEAELQQADDNQEEIRAIGDKIRKWSQGKQGNIRALLSTLQYVLWSESGWKPVPLVDIIEGNAVKRSYQRALLCLHPDKLQQKGATSNQKFTAEKVFDILQEAWTQFNSLGSL